MTSASIAGLETAQALADLDRVAGAIESVFLDAGERLGRALGCWRATAATFAGLAHDYEGDDMQRCVDGLQGALTVASALADDRDGAATARLADLAAALTAMAMRLERLAKTVGEVKLVALNAKVEAAHLESDRSEFGVFTQEIDRLAREAMAELAVLRAELNSLTSLTASAHDAQAGFNQGHGAELQAVCRRLEEGLHQLALRRRRIAEAAQHIGQRSAAAGDRVAGLISSLQIGDITRQRIEHVSQALGLLGDLPALAPSLGFEEGQQAAALVAGLQAAQLDHSAADLERDSTRVGDNLAALAAEAEEIARLGKASFGGDEGRSFLESLAAELARTQDLLEGYGNALGQTEAAMQVVTKATADMVAHVEAVHSIEADLKIMGLNASFKCARLGDKGRTLSVVAQTLRQLANRTVEDAGALMQGLDAARALADRLADGHTASAGIGGALEHVRAAARFMAADGAAQDQALGRLDDDSATARRLLSEAAGGIQVTADFSARLKAVAGQLHLAGAELDLPPERADFLRRQVLDNLAGNYTMASERALHDLFDGGGAAAEEEATVDVDDLLF